MNARLNPLPSLFVPHGAPTFALHPGATGTALRNAAMQLPRPRAIIVISAHWDTPQAMVGFAERPATIHDFWGFPQDLYAITYPATGSREASQEVLSALQAAGFPAQAATEQGLDHGAWIPLSIMFPEADIPVLPLSIQSRLGPEHHYRLGQALQPLTQRGFLVVASGNLTHNLADFQRAHGSDHQAPDYVRAFSDWFWQKLQAHDLPALLDYRNQAPAARQAHPRDEHLLPLYVALGAATADAQVIRLHAGIDDYVIAMDAFAFQPA